MRPLPSSVGSFVRMSGKGRRDGSHRCRRRSAEVCFAGSIATTAIPVAPVVQADGSYGLERGSNRGDAGHIFRPGDELSSNPNVFPYATPLAEPTLWPTGSVPTPMPSSVKTLQTSSFAGNVGSYGIQFDLLSLKATTIKSLSFHTDQTTLTSVQVHFRRGSYVGVERDASAWKLICDTRRW